MSDNSATNKVVAKQTREYNELLKQHNALMIVHTKTVNDYADKCMAFNEMKKSVKDLTKIIIQWEKENKILQESLDSCARDLMEATEQY